MMYSCGLHWQNCGQVSMLGVLVELQAMPTANRIGLPS